MISRRIMGILLIVPCLFASAQDRTETTSVGDSTEAAPGPLMRLPKDLWIQASSPFRMSSSDAAWAGAGLITTAVLISTDQRTHNAAIEAHNKAAWVRSAGPVVTEFGSTYAFILVAGFSGYAFVSDDSKAKETTVLALEAFLTAGFWGSGLKALAGRERPYASTSAGGAWTGPFGVLRKDKSRHLPLFGSFPSGHTFTAFSFATVFAEQYPEPLVVPILLYSTASLVGLSRITENDHWAADVFVGAAIGYLCAQEVLHNNRSESSRRTSATSSPNIRLGVVPGLHSPMLSLRAAF